MRLMLSSLRILVPSLLPFFQASTAERIDYGAHIGGALSGAALALLLLKGWPEGARIPQFRKAAAAVSTIGALLFAVSGCFAIANYPKFIAAYRQPQQRAAPPPAMRGAKPAAPSPPANVLSDEAAKRDACDFKWVKLNSHDPGSYQLFIQKCMDEN